jgi:hypothetical protein
MSHKCHNIYSILTQWSRILLENLTGFQPRKKFPAFYGTRRFIIAFTSARHPSLPWASSVQSIPPHMSILRCLGLTSVSVELRASCKRSVTRYVLRSGAVITLSNHQAGGLPPVGCPRMLIQYIRSYSANLRPFVHPQPWGCAMPWWQW